METAGIAAGLPSTVHATVSSPAPALAETFSVTEAAVDVPPPACVTDTVGAATIEIGRVSVADRLPSFAVSLSV